MKNEKKGVFMWGLWIGLIVVSLFSSIFTPAQSEIVTEIDRFTGNINITTKVKPAQLGRADIYIRGIVRPSDSPTFGLTIATESDHGWLYLNCHGLYWLVDGKPLSLSLPRHDGRVLSAGVLEFLNVTVSLEQLEILAKAKEIEFKICNDEFSASSEEMQDFKVFLEEISKAKFPSRSSAPILPAPTLPAPALGRTPAISPNTQLRNAEREFRAGRMSLEEFRQIKKVLQPTP